MRAVLAGRVASTLIEVVLALTLAVVAIFGVVAPLLGPGGFGVGTGPIFGSFPSVAVTLDVPRVAVDTDPDLPVAEGTYAPGEAVEFLIPTRTEVVLLDPDLQQKVALIGAPVLAGVLAIIVLFLLLRVVRSLRHGDPFVPVNTRRLFVIAATVGIGGQLAVLLIAWGKQGVLDHPLVEPYVVRELSASFVPLLAGLGIAVLAEVFRQGTRLRREVEGLV